MTLIISDFGGKRNRRATSGSDEFAWQVTSNEEFEVRRKRERWYSDHGISLVLRNELKRLPKNQRDAAHRVLERIVEMLVGGRDILLSIPITRIMSFSGAGQMLVMFIFTQMARAVAGACEVDERHRRDLVQLCGDLENAWKYAGETMKVYHEVEEHELVVLRAIVDRVIMAVLLQWEQDTEEKVS